MVFAYSVTREAMTDAHALSRAADHGEGEGEVGTYHICMNHEFGQNWYVTLCVYVHEGLGIRY